jgi:uncharacterized membrane protein
MTRETAALLAILGMGLVTYATRAGGLWLMGRLPTSPRLEAWLRQIPGAILISIVAPAALTTGPAEALASLATVLVAARTRNLLLAMVVGVAVVWALRRVLGS